MQTGQFLTPITGGTTDPSGTNVDCPRQRSSGLHGHELRKPSRRQRTINNWFDRTAFVTPKSNIGRFGMAGPGQLIGPNTRVFSAKLQKRFHVTEKTYLQVEGSATNLFNHTNFGLPARNLSSSTFGRITTTQSAEGAGPRNLQVGVRVNF